MARHTKEELKMYQALPLEVKIRMTEQRIRGWVNEYGTDGVYVSFSGGKDSTVLLDIVRNRMGYSQIPGVYVDTGLEYPEIRQFVKSFDNVVLVKPKMNFKQVIEKYGYPFFSKETSEAIYYARRYLKDLKNKEHGLSENNKDHKIISGYNNIADMAKIDRRENKDNQIFQDLKIGNVPSDIIFDNCRIKQLYGIMEHKEKGVLTGEYSKRYDKSRYKFMLQANFEVSNKCCAVMKKQPLKKYVKETNRHPMTAQMAEESALRESNWIKNGCNGFQMKQPMSNPMAFWTEQDVLEYIKKYNIPICSVYGEIVEDTSGTDEVQGQLTMSDLEGINTTEFDAKRLPLRTTGCSRTGCMFCGYGCHLEKEGEGRFEKMKITHPKQYEWIMKPWDQGGLGYKEIIDWINKHGGMNIRY